MKTNRLPPILPRYAEPAPPAEVTLVDAVLLGVGIVFFFAIACAFGAYVGVLTEFWAR